MSFEFEITKHSTLPEVLIIKPSVYEDQRGIIWTSFSKNLSAHLGETLTFGHDKFSKSKHGVLRGIHFDQKTYKLVTCVSGVIQQVVVDMRLGSACYKKWFSINLYDHEPTWVLIPPMFGNAFAVSSEAAVYHYKLAYEGEYADFDQQLTAKWNDPEIGIEWNIKEPILSKRDA